MEEQDEYGESKKLIKLIVGIVAMITLLKRVRSKKKEVSSPLERG